MIPDYVPVSEVDDSGKEYSAYKLVDYPSIIKSHGKVTLWSLDALMKAGIDPKFGISTGFGTRLQGVDELNRASSVADSILSDLEGTND